MRPPSSPSDGEEPRAPHFVQSLERGLAVIRAFDEHSPELTLSDVARRAGLTRAKTVTWDGVVEQLLG